MFIMRPKDLLLTIGLVVGVMKLAESRTITLASTLSCNRPYWCFEFRVMEMVTLRSRIRNWDNEWEPYTMPAEFQLYNETLCIRHNDHPLKIRELKTMQNDSTIEYRVKHTCRDRKGNAQCKCHYYGPEEMGEEKLLTLSMSHPKWDSPLEKCGRFVFRKYFAVGCPWNEETTNYIDFTRISNNSTDE